MKKILSILFALALVFSLAAVTVILTPQEAYANPDTYTITLYPTADNVMLMQTGPPNYSNINYGTAPSVAIQVYGTTGRQRSIVQFDLSSIPSDATIDTATLRLKTGSCVKGSCTGRTVWAYRLTQSWTETGSTWNTYDGSNNWGAAGGDYTTSGGGSSTVPSMGSWQQWDVQTIVQAWVDGTSTNYGFLLRDSNESYSTNTAWTYSSREGASDPQLYISYTYTPHVATATSTGTATFSTSSGTIQNLTAVAENTLPAAGKPNLNFPHGFFSFDITGVGSGGTAIVTITLPQPVPVGTQYWKYHIPEGWVDVTSLLGDDDGDNVLTLTLTDGSLGDDDGAADGTIVDQGGPGNPGPGPGPVGWETYPISKVRVLLPWIVLAAAVVAGASFLVVRRRRAQS